jgi:ribosomal protein L5
LIAVIIPLGLKEQLIFPEIDYEEVDQVQGFTINIILAHQSTALILSIKF